MANSSSEISYQARTAIKKLEPEILQIGDSGQMVQILQSILAELKLFNGKIDGIYGIKTANAIQRVQRHLGLEDTGIFDHDTWYGMTFWPNDLMIQQPPTRPRRLLFSLKQAVKSFL